MRIKKILTIASISVLLSACGGSSGGSGSGTDAVSDTDTGTDVDTGTDTNTGADVDTGTDVGTETDADTGTDVDTGTDADTGTDVGASDGISQFGFLSFNRVVFGQIDDIDPFIVGIFITLDGNADPDLDFERQFEEAIGNCEIDDGSDDGDDLDLINNRISAGETITVTSPAGTYATLAEMTLAGNDNTYLSQNSLALPFFPENLTIDISGGEFPSFTNISVPNTPPLDISPTRSDTITADTEFSWTPSSVPTSAITIEASYATDNGFLDIFCLARDDGSFSYPANIRDMIGSAEASFVTLARDSFNVVDSGNSRLLILNSFER